jgi:hypothetical protein
MDVDVDTGKLLSLLPTQISVSAKFSTGTTDSPSLSKSDLHKVEDRLSLISVSL